MRSTLRGIVAVALVPAGLLLAGAGSAFADVTTVRADANAESFGVLGPVGLVAVALGIVGMTLGVLRQRRKTRAATATAPAVPDGPVTAMAEAMLAVPTAPNGPATGMAEAMLAAPEGSVTAMAEAVLADPDATPTRPFSTQRPRT